MLLNGGELNGIRLLSQESVELMCANHIPDELLPLQFSPENVIYGHGYGLGLGVVLEQGDDDYKEGIGSYYWNAAYGTTFVVIPQKSLVGILMTQFLSTDPLPFKKQFRALVYEAV